MKTTTVAKHRKAERVEWVRYAGLDDSLMKRAGQIRWEAVPV